MKSDEVDARGPVDLRHDLLEAHASGLLMERIRTALIPDSLARETLASTLVELHNDGQIDVVAVFSELRNLESQQSRFFSLLRVLESILARLNCPVSAVMECALRLYKEAGRDQFSGTIVDSFVAYCAADAQRPKAALDLIEASPEAFVDLLPAVIASGSPLDWSRYLGEAIRLSVHPSPVVRQRALFALSYVSLPEGLPLPDELVVTLERATQIETDDQVLASILTAASRLYKRGTGLEKRFAAVVDGALAKAGERTVAAGCRALLVNASTIDDRLLGALLHGLKGAKLQGAAVGDTDLAVSTLIQGEHAGRALDFLECILVGNPELLFAAFDSTAIAIIETAPLASKVLTRWLLSGERSLCDAVAAMVAAPQAEAWQPEIDPAELHPADSVRMLFVGRKAVGYLFTEPLAAARIVVSLMRHAPDEECFAALRSLLFDPLLLNYTGSVRQFVKERSELDEPRVADALREALEELDEYLSCLRTVGHIAALAPSEAQRDAQWRHFTQEVQASMKAAEADSVLLSLVSKSVILYGLKSIDYVCGPHDERRRIEIELGSHGVEVEVPRLFDLDPFGLDYQLRVFRAEQVRA